MDLSIPIGERFTLAFPTPIYHRQWPEEDPLHGELREVILARKSKEPGIRAAQVGGWHSRTDLLEWPEPAIAMLRERMSEAVAEMIQLLTDGKPSPADLNGKAEAWANVATRGNFHALHDHAASTFSGVYYVSVGKLDADVDPNENGAFVVPDPRYGVGMIPTPGSPFGRMLKFPPRTGLMLVFPSWLRHMANPYSGEDERISVSFNIHSETAKR